MISIWPTRREIIQHRGPKNRVSVFEPYAFLHECEVAGPRHTATVNTIFLSAAECSFKCLFCDLWKNTLDHPTPPGAIPVQLEHALARLPRSRWIKLYNSGNFFDPHSIPPADWPAIAQRIDTFERVIVENHAALCDERIGRFADLFSGRLEVAVGLETSRADVLPHLNKRMTTAQFRTAAETIQRCDADLRVFLIVGLPGVRADECIDTALEDIRFAAAAGARHVSLIPARDGNGIMERLRTQQHFVPPTQSQLLEIMQRALPLAKSLVTMDLWDWRGISGCDRCEGTLYAALEEMNRTQLPTEIAACDECANAGAP